MYAAKSFLLPVPYSYTISGINFSTAKPLPMPPQGVSLGFGLKPGEVDMSLVDVIGAPEQGTKIANLDRLVLPEDLNLIANKSLQ